MEKKVNFCGNCPFFVTSYDDFAVGESTTHTCNLALFQNKEDYFLELDYYLKTPEWCPIKKEEYSFRFKDFTKQRLDQINITNKKIEELEKYFEDVEVYDTPIFIEKSDELQKNYSNLAKLHENEELLFYEDEIKDKVGEIKEQLDILENAGAKLQESFMKLGNLNKDEDN